MEHHDFDNTAPKLITFIPGFSLLHRLPTEVPDFLGEGCACPPPVYRSRSVGSKQSAGRPRYS